jgi:Domain of unknown function (DUF4271)
MISYHKGNDNTFEYKQDTTKNKSQGILINPGNVDDTTKTVNDNNVLLTSPSQGFTPLPSLDSVRIRPKKVKTYFNPLNTTEYLKYKDSFFNIADEGTLFTEKSYDQKSDLSKILTSKNKKKVVQTKVTEPKKDISAIIEEKSFLENNFISKNSNNTNYDFTQWILGILIFVTILFSWIRVFNNKHLKSLYSALLNNQWSKKLFEEKNVVSQRISFVLNLLFCLNLSLLIIFLLVYFNYSLSGLSGFQSYLLVLAAITLLFIGKYIVLNIIGWLALAKNHFGEYIHNVFLFYKIYGLFLLPILWIIPFVEENIATILIYIAIGSFAIIYIWRVLRGIYNCIRINVSIFYLILYLCALEIFPVLLVYKAITSMM